MKDGDGPQKLQALVVLHAHQPRKRETCPFPASLAGPRRGLWLPCLGEASTCLVEGRHMKWAVLPKSHLEVEELFLNGHRHHASRKLVKKD